MDSSFDIDWLKNCSVNELGVKQRVTYLKEQCQFDSVKHEAAWLLKAVTLIDLTTLAGDDTSTNVNKLCCKAAHPIPKATLKCLLADCDNSEAFSKLIRTAAVCVYPSRVTDAVRQLDLLQCDIPVASVATGFPSGQYPLKTRLQEIEFCVEQGAREIDIVLDRSLVIGGKWHEVYDEVKAMVDACGGKAHLKAILATGECGSLDNVAKASLTCILAGADFIKTSTGKEAVNATLEFGVVMCRMIRFYYLKTGKKIGLKPAGGLKTYKDALEWLYLVKCELGDEWLQPSLFRIGASSLLGDIVNRLSVLAKQI